MKEKILAMAKCEIKRHGTSFRMDDLAYLLNISKRTLYENFSSKKEIVETIIFAEIDYIYTQHQLLLADATLSVEDKLIGYFSVRSNTFILVTEDLSANFFNKYPELFDIVTQRFNKDWFLLEQFIRESQQTKKLADFDVGIFLTSLHGAMMALYEHREEFSYYKSVVELMRSVIEIMIYGIKKNGGLKKNDNE